MLASKNEITRYLAKNATFHIGRITAYLWKDDDNWSNKAVLKGRINKIISTPDDLNKDIDSAVTILNEIISKKPHLKTDLNNALKSGELDTEINKTLNLKFNKPAPDLWSNTK